MTTSALERLEAMYTQALHEERWRSLRDLDPRLHDYQVDAVRHLHSNAHAGLFLEMGLGKTAATLQALTPAHLPVLVIAPKRVTENVWPTEAKTWRPDLTIAIAAGTPAKRAAALASGADIVAIGRDNVKDLQVGQFKTIVLDELSSFKNRGSQRWKMVKKITDAAPYVWGLTGTPAPNGLMDLWAQVYLLDSGARLGRTLTAFRNRYFTIGRQLSTGVVIEWNLRPGAAEKIESALGDLCLSMKSADHLDLPPVVFNDVVVPLPPKAQAVYDEMATHLVTGLGEEAITAANAGVMTGKLSQISAGFLYADDEGAVTRLHDGKTEAVQEIIDGTGSPVLVFYQYVEERDALMRAIPNARRIEEKGIIDEWNAGQVPVLIAHPASAGHGLNLQAGGHTMIWSSLTWSDEEYEQGIARLARQGQTNTVVVHRLMSASIDDAKAARLERKISIQEALMQALKKG